MKVKQLIAELSKMGGEAEVLAYHCKDCAGDSIEEVKEEYGSVILK